ncbi:uncharacterized protein PITG_12509 [Phytophthora infestans T30-4]|uniref:Ubiquitin-like protease family profile domain-containing protein n=1 Tax=Phytophthora infestans (strain T30-4) TaxID=403677 RepID=D0NKP7_PHYIT|nr:uncharacterized protein PITG_12509 [Phytophthora infestans T30-4]EEY60183.1 hypothetical protein PITG_12509 [Phytophthora infestans T30-4]|eukprot:XP_002900390.1 hypothetical protein PITG_12509 [Phytophthora infestans T30-4]
MELDFGGQVTNYECVVEKSTNVENAGDSVTNSDTNSEGVGGRTIDLPLSVDDPEDEVAPLTLSAGRPKEPRATKKVKARKGIEETKVLAHQLTSLDGCIFVAALHTAHQAQTVGQNRGGVAEIFVVDPVYLGFKVEAERKRMIDTELQILSKGASGRVVFSPVNIQVDVAHWCGAIVDFRSCSIWIYDPKQKVDYIDEVEDIMKSSVVPLIDPAFVFDFKYSSAWLQKDGYNCGVFIVKWFETYLKVAMHTVPEENRSALTPQQISDKDIEKCRYEMFETVCLDIFES